MMRMGGNYVNIGKKFATRAGIVGGVERRRREEDRYCVRRAVQALRCMMRKGANLSARQDRTGIIQWQKLRPYGTICTM